MVDVFRKAYRQLNPDEVAGLDAIKGKAAELYDMLERLTFIVTQPVDERTGLREFTITGDGRSMALAKTKLEEAVMWAVKGITG